MLAEDRLSYYRQFLQDYETIREQEGRRSKDPGFYGALPFKDLGRRFEDQWSIRAHSFRALVKHVLETEERTRGKLCVADLGAGNGWLSYRLAERGHEAMAVDLSISSWDGLGARSYYSVAFECLRAEFDSLPLGSRQFDLVIYNASIHYSSDYARTLQEGFRVLKTDGKLVIMDSPIYQDRASGEQMLRENREAFRRRFGRSGDALPMRGYLTWRELHNLANWKYIEPNYGLRWRLRPVIAKLLGRREPARFGLLVAGESRQEDYA